MDVTNAITARTWIASLGSYCKAFLLADAVRVLTIRASILESYRDSSNDWMDTREAIGEIRSEYFAMTGRAIIV
jgi:hypothetical protein